jgi:hypothetical protein
MIFREDEGKCVGSQYDSTVSRSPQITSKTEFYCINPLDPLEDYAYEKKPSYDQYKPRRADANVTSFRNFIFEIDTIPLKDQLEALEKTGIDFTAIIYSGGKSYHAIIALEEGMDLLPCNQDSVVSYKRVWSQIAEYINKVAEKDVVDKSCKNPSRLTRMPNSIRSNGNTQKLISVGELMSNASFNELLEKCPPIYTPVIQSSKEYDLDHEVVSVADFYSNCPQGLKLLLKYPTWADMAGNYPHLFRLTLWAIDSTMIEKALFLEVLEDRVFPEFVKNGYPRHRWYDAVNHAYNMKGVV